MMIEHCESEMVYSAFFMEGDTWKRKENIV